MNKLGTAHLQIVLKAWDSGPLKYLSPPTHLHNTYIDQLEEMGLLEQRTKGAFSTTSKCGAFVKMLCATPLPVRANVWEDKRTKKLYHPYGLIGSKSVT